MQTKKNIGKWTVKVKKDGKAPQIIVTGSFPTNGEKPFYHLVKNEPQDSEELVLTLVFGFLVVPTGKINHSAVFTEVINTIEQYKSILIVDDSENPRTLANITVLEEYSFINNEQKITADFTPYLETLMGIEITDSKLKIRTHTGGCTTEDSFEISINKGFTGLPPYIVEIYRIAPDYCKGYFPEGILLEYDLATLGLEPFATFSLTNKIGNLK